MNIDIRDIERCHRLGKPGTDEEPWTKPQDIIVKFGSYRPRSMFYKARTQTKENGYQGVFVNENLTKVCSKLLYEARRRVKSKQVKSAWSSDGNILIKTTNDNGDEVVRRISSVTYLPTYIAPSAPAAGGATGTS